MDKLYIALALASVLVLGVGAFSKVVKRIPLSEPIVAVAFGVLVGPVVLGWADPASWGPTEKVLALAARLTLAVGLMGVALRIGHEALRAVWRPAIVLLTLVMLGMCAISTAAAAWWLQVGFWTALLIGAVITPTDPVVASAIVTGPFAQRYLPEELKASLSLESGANDGLAFLLVMLPVMAMHHGSVSGTLTSWLVDGLLVGVLLAIVIGLALGMGSATLLDWVRRHDLIGPHSLLSYTLALSFCTLGIARLCGTDELVAVFVAGLTFNLSVDTGEQHEEENIQEAVSKLYTLPIFILFGAVLPWGEWARMGWPLAAFAVTIVLLRRPPVFALLFPLLRRFYRPRDAAYLGWFGPVGIAAVLYAADAWDKTGDPMIWHVTSAVVLASVVVHGVTAAPFTLLYHRVADRPRAGGAVGADLPARRGT